MFLRNIIHIKHVSNFSIPETKIAEFVHGVNPDEVAHNEPPRLDLHCLPSSFVFTI